MRFDTIAYLVEVCYLLLLFLLPVWYTISSALAVNKKVEVFYRMESRCHRNVVVYLLALCSVCNQHFCSPWRVHRSIKIIWVLLFHKLPYCVCKPRVNARHNKRTGFVCLHAFVWHRKNSYCCNVFCHTLFIVLNCCILFNVLDISVSRAILG